METYRVVVEKVTAGDGSQGGDVYGNTRSRGRTTGGKGRGGAAIISRLLDGR